MPSPAHILVVEDDPAVRALVSHCLEDAGFRVTAVADGERGAELATAEDVRLAVLDVGLPGIDGLTLTRELRVLTDIGIIILSAQDQATDRIVGLEIGADDYMVKPFAFDELLARIRALVRRGYQDARPQLVAGGLRFDPARQAVEVDGQAVGLSPRERALLELLLRRRGQYVGRAELHEHLYAFDEEPESNVIAVTLCSLRRKLRMAGCPELISSRRRLGYRLLAAPS